MGATLQCNNFLFLFYKIIDGNPNILEVEIRPYKMQTSSGAVKIVSKPN